MFENIKTFIQNNYSAAGAPTSESPASEGPSSEAAFKTFSSFVSATSCAVTSASPPSTIQETGYNF